VAGFDTAFQTVERLLEEGKSEVVLGADLTREGGSLKAKMAA
jgi:hypothetical protein